MGDDWKMFRRNSKMGKNEKLDAEEEKSAQQTENIGAEASDNESNNEVTKLQSELQELNDKYIRLYSEFDNFKRRTIKERQELAASAGKDVLVALLPVLDDFERAEKSLANTSDVEAVKQGIDLIHHKLKNILTQKGLKSMESIGQELNVDFHEAITTVPAPSEDLKGKIVDEVEKGYSLNDKVIRFAKVILGE